MVQAAVFDGEFLDPFSPFYDGRGTAEVGVGRRDVADMALTSVDLLSGIIAPNAAAFRGFDALAIDHARRWTGLPAHGFSCRHNQVMVDRSKNTIVPPIVEISANRRDRWEVVWEHAPLAARRGHIQNGVKHITQVRRARTPARLRWRQQRRNLAPFFIGRIACISTSGTFIIRAGDFSSHLVPPHLLRHKRESHK